ncbi:MAG: FAD-dependent oxidoreductase [Lachnospiraceae bacterium]|nr:FAD-dependent oxidoreductase [Lachnospiraceae bacterium]
MKLLVIGGVAAGTKAAAKFKRVNPEAEVTIVTKGKDISYAGCGLPYYVGGAIQEKEQLIVNTPEKYSALTGAMVYPQREVTTLDPAAKKAIAKNLRTGAEEVYAYDKCIVAVGASPVVPPLPGLNLPGVFVMRTPDDAIETRDYIARDGVKRAVVVGGGFIGLEVAENLLEKGMSVTLIDMAPQIMPGFDVEMADYAVRHLAKKGIKVLTATRLEGVTGEERAEGVQTDQGLLPADVVILSIGIRPNTGFLQDTGIEMFKGTILVDDKMATNVADIYAAGDCAMVKNRLTGERQWSPMGSSANMEGRTLALALGGREVTYPGVLGTGVVKLPGLSGGRTGLSEEQAKAAGYKPACVLAVTDDKAHYYPDSAWFAIKLVADMDTHKLLGVQVLGPGAVDKVTDIGVMAVTFGASLEQMTCLDLAYAPPFSTAIHPFVQAVHMLLNKINGDMDSFTPAEYRAGAAEGYRIIDVNPAGATITGATYVDLLKVKGEVPGLAKGEKLLLVCAKGKRGYLLQNRLKRYGYTNTKVLEGASFFNEVRAEGASGVVTVPAEEITRVKALGCLHNKGTDNFNVRVITRNGKITTAEHKKIAEAAERFGNGDVVMTTRLTLEIVGVPFDKIEELRAFLAEEGLETGGTGSKVRPVVACKGTTCQYGLLDSYGLSEKIHERFFHGYADVKLPHKFKIAVGGCPNNCVKPDLNDFGIVGQRVPVIDLEKCRGCGKCQVSLACPVGASQVVDGKLVIDPGECNNCGRCVGKCPFKAAQESTYGYRVYIGGRWGKRVAHGRKLEKIFLSEEEVLSVLEKAILLFREQGKTGERFADTIDRIGFENVQEQLMSDEILKFKDQILNAKMHMEGGATC